MQKRESLRLPNLNPPEIAGVIDPDTLEKAAAAHSDEEHMRTVWRPEDQRRSDRNKEFQELIMPVTDMIINHLGRQPNAIDYYMHDSLVFGGASQRIGRWHTDTPLWSSPPSFKAFLVANFIPTKFLTIPKGCDEAVLNRRAKALARLSSMGCNMHEIYEAAETNDRLQVYQPQPNELVFNNDNIHCSPRADEVGRRIWLIAHPIISDLP